MKKIIFCRIFLLAFLLSSCSFFNHNVKDSERSDGAENGLVTVSGSIKEKAFLAERTAVPSSTDNTASYDYTVVAQSKSSGEKYECTVSGTNFSVRLKSGSYIFIANGVENSSNPSSPNTSESPAAKKLSGSLSVTVAADGTTTPTSISITVKPVANTFGTGEAALPICVDNGNTLSSNPIRSARAYWTLNGTRYNQNLSFMTSDTIANPQTFNFPVTGSTVPMEMPSGSHTVQFYFSTSNTFDMSTVCYYFSEVVNIYDGFVTNTWVDSGNADYLVTSGSTTSVLITQDCIESFKRTNFFVKSDGQDNVDGEVRGSYFKPFQTIQKALGVIGSMPHTNPDEVYTINLLSNISSEVIASLTPPSTSNLYIKIQSYDFEDAPYSIDFTEHSGFAPQTSGAYKTVFMFKDLEIKNVKSDSGISTNMANTYFGGYIKIQENTDSSGTKCNVKLSSNSEKINLIDSTSHFTAVPLDSRSKIGVTIPASATTFPYTITNGYSASLTTANPMTIFTGDVGYIAGWNEGATVDTWHTEATLAQSSGITKAIITGPMNMKFNAPEIIVSTGTNGKKKDLENIHWVKLGSAQTGSAVGDLIVPNEIKITLYRPGGDGNYNLYPPASISYEITVSRENKFIKNESGTSSDLGAAISKTPAALGITEEGLYTINVNYKNINGQGYAASENYYVTDNMPLCVYAAQQEFKAKNVSGFTASVPTTGTYSVGTLDDMHLIQDMVNGNWKPDGENVVKGTFDFKKSNNTYDRATLNLISNISLQKESWTSIGPSDTDFFAGNFDGKNHTIRDLWLPLDQYYNGLFGYIKRAVIKDLNVVGSTKRTDGTLPVFSGSYVGGIAAYLGIATMSSNEADVLINCAYYGDITLLAARPSSEATGNINIGGITGATGTATYTNCGSNDYYHIIGCKNYADISITTKNDTSNTTNWKPAYIGGIVGINSCQLKECINYGKMTVSEDGNDISYINPITYVAGISGFGQGIYRCKNYGDIIQKNGNNAYISGIISYHADRVEECENYGNINSEQYTYTYPIEDFSGSISNNPLFPLVYTAGIVAYANGSRPIKNCTNYGDVHNNADCCGGVIGFVGTNNGGFRVKSCDNHGKITANRRAGGLLGFDCGATIIEDSNNSGEIACLNPAYTNCDSFGGIIGETRTGSTLVNCTNNARIKGCHNVGGIVGLYSKTSSLIRFVNCKNSGYIAGTNYIAGILGEMDGNTTPGATTYFINCLNSGMIEQTGTDGSNKLYSAGIFCDRTTNNTSTTSKVHNCVNIGIVYSTQYAAGIGNISYKSGIDNRYGGPEVVKNCYYLLGSVQANNGEGLSGGIPGFYVAESTSVSEMVEAFPSDATKVAQFGIKPDSGQYIYTIVGGGDLVTNLNAYVTSNSNYTQGTAGTVGYVSCSLKTWDVDSTTLELGF